MVKTQSLSPLTLETAPIGNRPALEQIKKSFGFVPNMLATISNSEAALNGYLALDGWYRQSSLTPVEREVVQLVASLTNGCDYCKAAHSTVLVGFMNVPKDDIDSIRAGMMTGNGRIDALVALTKNLVEFRGAASEEVLEKFYSAGFTPVQVLGVNIGIALKVLSNYTDRTFHVEIDAPFQNFA